MAARSQGAERVIAEVVDHFPYPSELKALVSLFYPGAEFLKLTQGPGIDAVGVGCIESVVVCPGIEVTPVTTPFLGQRYGF